MPAPTIDEYLPLCFSVAKGFARRNPKSCDDWHELVSGAYVGLTESVDRFDPTRATGEFVPFTIQRMKWRIVELLRRHGIYKRRLRGARDRPLTYHYFNLDREGREAIENMPDPILDPMHFAAKRDSAAKLWEIVQASLLPKHAIIFVLYYSYGWTYKQIGDHFGVTESRICQIHAKSLPKLRKACTLAGFA